MSQLAEWVRIFAICAAASVVFEVLFREHGGQTRWVDIPRAAWPGFVVSAIICTLSVFVLPRLVPILDRGIKPWQRWTIVIGTLIGVAAAGGTLAVVLLASLGSIDSWDAFIPRLRDTMKIAIPVTLVFGIYTTLNHALKARLDQTTVALRTKERDEAEARRIASEAELVSLESRVNPHFLFNTLNSIAALSRKDGARTERMTTQLASLMRSSLDQRSAPLVPLAQEVQSVRDYLDIEQVRFGARLRYHIHIAEDARALVPRLALQTLVENCVKYAVSPRRGGASLSVSAHRADGRVCIEITDDGPGFDAGAIREGHGLALIRDRLALLHGGDARLSVRSQSGKTTIALIVPALDDHA
jgi:sensor histidine kinase YesM